MAGRTHGDKIDELSTSVATLAERVHYVRGEVEFLHVEQNKTTELMNDLRTKFAVLDERLGELKKTLEETSRRRWAVVPSLVGGVIGALLTFLLQLLIMSLQSHR